MVFSFTKNRSFVREHFTVSQLEHTYSFIHARNFLGIELSYAEENVLIYICLQKWAISFRSYYLSKIRDLRTSSENSSKILATTLAVQYKRYSRVQKLARKLFQIQRKTFLTNSRRCYGNQNGGRFLCYFYGRS